jgi:aminobenzoyl-glutamate utilization protein A
VSSHEASRLIRLRRDLHRHPELGWCEFYTTARIVEEVEDIGVDELYVGPELLTEERFRPPEAEDVALARERAREAGVDESFLDELGDGYTGLVAVLRMGDGPTVGLRVDIDALPRLESDEADHPPVAHGFRSRYDGMMHACGHDGHAAIGVGVLEAVKASDFEGTLKVFFQPAEETGAGAASIVGSGHLADVDSLLAVHLGLDEETGTVIPGVNSFLAVSGFTAEFRGEPAHAGGAPQDGENAVQAMSTAIGNLYGIPRHADGGTRINAGVVSGGTAPNIIPEAASIRGEVRGQTTELREYMEERARAVIDGAAAVHGCAVDVGFSDGAPSAESDESLADRVAAAAEGHGANVLPDRGDTLGGSEDATRLMLAVQANGGEASYVGVGASNPAGHHTARFDIDEDAIPFAVDVLTDAVRSV